MKILLVNDYATPTGGAEVALLGLRDGLRSRGHDARLFATRAGAAENKALMDYSCFGTTSRFRTLLQTANIHAYIQLNRTLAAFKPDVVHVKMFLTQLSPLILPLLKRIPSIYHVEWYRPVCPLGTKMLPDGTPCRVPAGTACYRHGCLPLRDWVPLMLQMKLWRRWRDVFDVVVANSEATKQQLTAAGIEPVKVILNGVPIRPPRPPLAWPPTVGFAGRLVREKGVDVLLPAFAKVLKAVPEAKLLIVGQGPEEQRLRELIALYRLAPHVEWRGHVNNVEINGVLDNSWVQVVPSRWAEPFGLVAAEAMMRGTAVIACRSGGLVEIVADGRTGLLVPIGDAESLAAAMLELLQNKELAEEMGAHGRELAIRNFNQDRVVEDFLDLYESSTSRRVNDG